MRGVDVAFEGLQPVAFALDEERLQFRLVEPCCLDFGHWRCFGARSHVDPDQACLLGRAVGLGLDLLHEGLIGWQIGHVQRNCRRRRTSSHDRRSGCRRPRCGRRTAKRSGAGSDGPSRRRGRCCRGMRSAFRPAASAAAARRLAGTSDDFAAGIQYCRINCPIGVPGPMRVSSWLSIALVIILSPTALARLRGRLWGGVAYRSTMA